RGAQVRDHSAPSGSVRISQVEAPMLETNNLQSSPQDADVACQDGAQDGARDSPRIPSTPARTTHTLMPRMLAAALRKALQSHPAPSFRLAFADGEEIVIGDHPVVSFYLRSPTAQRMMAWGDLAGLGDAYAAGEVEIDGSAEDITSVCLAITQGL